MKPYNILITGSGGQGVVLTGNLLSKVFLEYNLIPNTTMNHGFSQRGGYVLYHLRVSDKTISPVIENESAHHFLYLHDDDDRRYKNYLMDSTKILHVPTEISDKLPFEKLKNVVLVGMLLKDLTLYHNNQEVTFAFDKVASIIKTKLKKYVNENIKALEMGYHV